MLAMDFKITSDLQGIKNLEKYCRTINKRHIRFGWYEGKKYPASHENSGIPIAQVAYWQEYGSSSGGRNIPSRPYFRQTKNIVKNSYNSQIKSIFLTGIFGNDMSGGLNRMADSIVLDYQKTVAKQNNKKLSAYTIALKGHTYQMFDSGVMMANFKAKVYHQNQVHIKD